MFARCTGPDFLITLVLVQGEALHGNRDYESHSFVDWNKRRDFSAVAPDSVLYQAVKPRTLLSCLWCGTRSVVCSAHIHDCGSKRTELQYCLGRLLFGSYSIYGVLFENGPTRTFFAIRLSITGVKDAGLQLPRQIQQYISLCSRTDYVRASAVAAVVGYAVVDGLSSMGSCSICVVFIGK